VEAFVEAATDRQKERAEAMLEARPEIADDPWAALVLGYGNGEAVRLLLERGARIETDPEGETPLDWAVWSSRHLEHLGLDYVPVAEALIGAGERVEPRHLDTARGPLREWLQLEHPGEL
jgi:hypothetical protein